MKLWIIGAAFTLTLAGCVSMGTNYNPEAVATLQPGMSQAAVVGLLGKPNATAQNADGTRVLVWTHSKGSALGAKARSVSLLFDAQGNYVRMISSTQTEMN
jgi:ABC-type uncharacterized transport system auxiliary subunit